MSVATMIGQAREIPLGAILRRAGLTPRREGSTTRYKNDQFNIVVSPNNLWFDNAAAIGGRGAIDLALHLKCRVNPKLASHFHLREALDWLGQVQPGGGTPAPLPSENKPAPPKESFENLAGRLAIRDDGRWPLARHYLVHTRRLPADLVDPLYDHGDLYASFSGQCPEQTGVCFVHRNLEGEARGATIRSIASSGPGYRFSIGEKLTAWFTVGDASRANRAVVVESPIDAMSYVAMKRPDRTVVLSMSCAHVLRPVLQAAHDRRWSLEIGLNNDKAGYAGWERCQENQRQLYPEDPPATRIRPEANDWNDDLCAAARRSHGRRL